MNVDKLILELDVTPADLRSRRAVDFAGRSVTSFTRMTPFQPGEWGEPPHPGLLVRARPSRGGRRWTLEPHHDNRWSSGRPMTVAQVTRTIVDNLEANGAILARAEVAGGLAVVDLNRPFGCLPDLLSADAFAPVCRASGDDSGPYSHVGNLGSRALGLRRNAAGDQMWPDGPDALIFTVTADPAQGVRLFERGLIDVTCNPNLPPAALLARQGSPTVRQRDFLLAGVLLIARPDLKTPEARDVRRQISAAIDRKRLCADQDLGLAPLHDLTDLWRDSSPPGEDFVSPQKLPRQGPLTLAYADFAPNGTVAASIAEDLCEKLDLEIVLRPLSYEAYLDCLEKAGADLIYTLIQPPFNDPTGLLANLAPWLDGRANEYRAALQAAEALLDPQERLEACAAAAGILAHETPFAPIVRVESRCLVSARAASLRLGPDGIFRPPLRAT